MTWTRRWAWPSASPCCTTARSSSRARVPRWSPTRAPGRCILATEALDVSGIDAYYGDSHVLHAVSFGLKGGRLLGLLGRNGAGKTTCMATIMGFLKPRPGPLHLPGGTAPRLPPHTIPPAHSR